MGVRWYVAYPLSTRHVEELMEEGGVEVDHSTINRWVIKYSPQLEIYQSCNLHKTFSEPTIDSYVVKPSNMRHVRQEGSSPSPCRVRSSGAAGLVCAIGSIEAGHR